MKTLLWLIVNIIVMITNMYYSKDLIISLCQSNVKSSRASPWCKL